MRGLDLQDCLLTAGIVLLELAAAFIWWPAALILGGLFCLCFSFLIERAKKLPKPQHGNPKP